MLSASLQIHCIVRGSNSMTVAVEVAAGIADAEAEVAEKVVYWTVEQACPQGS